MKTKIENIIFETLVELNEELNINNIETPNIKTKLYGGSGYLDSLALVSFISDLEYKFSDELDIDLIIADERAMSQKTSPFRNIESLVNYILQLIEKEKV